MPVQVHGIRVNAALDPIDPAVFPLMHVPVRTAIEYPTVAASGGDFLTGGSRDACDTPSVSFLTHVSASGVVTPPDMGRPLAEEAGSVRVVGAASAAGNDVALWVEPGDATPHLLAARLGRDSSPIVVSPNAAYVASASDGRNILTIDNTCSDAYLLDSASGGVSRRTRPCGVDDTAFDVAWSGSHYVAAVMDGYTRLDFLRIAADGTLLGTTRLDEEWIDGPTIAATRDNSVVVWRRSVYPDALYATAVGDTGRIMFAPHAIAPSTVRFALASDGTSFLLLTKNGWTVTGYLLSADSTVVDQAVLDESASGFDDTLQAVRAGDRWIAIWNGMVHAFSTLHAPVISTPAPEARVLLTRPDGSVAVVMTAQRERDGMKGKVVVEREIEVTARQRRRAF